MINFNVINELLASKNIFWTFVYMTYVRESMFEYFLFSILQIFVMFIWNNHEAENFLML